MEDIAERNIQFLETRKIGKCNIVTLATKKETTSLLAAPLEPSAENYMLLSNFLSYFEKDLTMSAFVDMLKVKGDIAEKFNKKYAGLEGQLNTSLNINFNDDNSPEKKEKWKAYPLSMSLYASLIAVPGLLINPSLFGLGILMAIPFTMEAISISEDNSGGLSGVVAKIGIFRENKLRRLRKFLKKGRRIKKRYKRP